MNTKTTSAIVGAVVAMSLVTNAVTAQQAVTGKQRQEFMGPLKVFILAGQSSMEGQGVVSMDGERDYNGGKGNLVWSMKNSKSAEKMKCLQNEKGEWVVRDDVQISFKVGDKVRKGGLTVGYTGYGGSSHIGPELGFGFVIGDYLKEPVLLVKTAWGGKSLYVDFRPPSSGGQVGPYYTKMVEEVRAALVELGDQKYELAGFVWQQGWNDMCTKPAIPEYAQNLVNLINDLRKEFKAPNMPVVVGELGNGGPVTKGDMAEFRKAQEEGTKNIKNALFIKTTDFARPAEFSPNPGHGHHWFGNAESYFLIGDALGEGMKRLLQLPVSDSTTNELTVVAGPRGVTSEKRTEQDRAGDRLSPAVFVEPPLQARPGAFWDWLNGSITQEQITRDLEAMKRGGMRGGEIWDVAAYADPDGRVPAGPAFLGPESTRLVVHAIREADRLGLEIGMIASSGWNAGGSWIPPDHAGKGLYQSVTTVTGPKEYHAELPLPELPKLCPRDANGRPLYLREVAVLAVPHDKSKTLVDVNQVVDLKKRIEADGKLRWEVPAGEWDILRFVCANHGQQLIVPSPNSGGPMIDFFHPRATEFHLHHIVKTILKELGHTSFEGTSFKTLEFDSMELDGFTPWNEIVAAEFERRAGYPVLRFLPVLAGWKLSDQHVHKQFLYDWQKMVSDLLIDSHYVTAQKVLGSYGLKFIAESGGPGAPIWDSNPVDGIKALGAVDIPRGEFWNRHRGIFLVKEIASAAHVYDKRLVSAESFTTWRRWIDGPLNHKQLADRALCEGLNDFAFHTFASSPPEAGFPGWAYHAGTDINPSATWWPMVRSLTDYIARCSYMLRQGWFVADVCYYYGDQAPNFYPPLCNVPEKPALDGLDPRSDYDVCSSQVILQRMRVENHRIMLPDGMSYAALVLPEQDHIPAVVLEKIHALVVDGATVIACTKPTRAPGMKEQKTETENVLRLADALWGQGEVSGRQDKQSVLFRPIGQGQFIIASDRSAALRKMGVEADFEIAGRRESNLGPLDFIHRKTLQDEFYFVRNKTTEPQTLTCRFRVATTNGLAPEFWWPDSGRRSACHAWKSLANGQTELPVTLGPLGSAFVVFRKAGAALDAIARDTFVAAETPAPLTLAGPWQVGFPEGWGAPRETSFDKLQSWTESDNEGIRFYSGITTYRKTIEVPESLAKRDRLFLELGDLAEIADVTLNGKRLGLAWLPPYRIEISGAAHAGANQLEIRVANLWANRLNGDSLRPESDRFTRSNIDRIQTDPTSDSSYGKVPSGKTRPVYTVIPPLMKSGLFGPVRIITPKD